MTKPRKPGRVTLREVAEQTGVSLMTVSNVVNGRLGSMSSETRQRIEEAVAALGYRPHAVARNLRADRRHAVGMLIVDRSETALADPWITNLVTGLSHRLGLENYSPLLQTVSPDRLEEAPVFHQEMTDGLCVVLSGPEPGRRQALTRLAGLGQPIVLFQERWSAMVGDACLVRQDDRGGGLVLGRLVIGQGARRLLMLTADWEWAALSERERGVRQAIAEVPETAVSLDVLPCGDESFEQTVGILGDYLRRHRGGYDAILAGNDQMGIAALKVLRGLGLAVPERVLVTGFNAFAFWQYSDPVLTTIRSPSFELGALGAEVLLDRLSRGAFDQPEHVLPVELKLGQSTWPAVMSTNNSNPADGAAQPAPPGASPSGGSLS